VLKIRKAKIDHERGATLVAYSHFTTEMPQFPQNLVSFAN
jgi:hypothetical protein